MFAQVYRECQKVGLTPREVDDMELWEIAVALGADRVDDDKPMDSRALLRARVAHAEGRGPKPEAPGMSPAEYNTLINALGPMAVG